MNSIYVPNAIGMMSGSSLNSWYRPQDIAHPKPKGNAMPATPTLIASLQFLTKYRKSTSRPTKNKKRTRPRLATSVRFGIESVGKMASVKPGILPITEGPSNMPPMTSAITRGWRSRESG